MQQAITIEPRFCGPPDSGNGGYVCGVLAGYLDGIAEVTLRKPPPLSKPLQVYVEAGKAKLMDNDVLVAEAASATLTLDAPPPVDFETAREATRNYKGVTGHVFPTCFVCMKTLTVKVDGSKEADMLLELLRSIKFVKEADIEEDEITEKEKKYS